MHVDVLQRKKRTSSNRHQLQIAGSLGCCASCFCSCYFFLIPFLWSARSSLHSDTNCWLNWLEMSEMFSLFMQFGAALLFLFLFSLMDCERATSVWGTNHGGVCMKGSALFEGFWCWHFHSWFWCVDFPSIMMEHLHFHTITACICVRRWVQTTLCI